MRETTTAKGEKVGRLGIEAARLMLHTTEAYLMGQVGELQADVALIRELKAAPSRKAKAAGKARRAQIGRRIAEIEARIAQQCHLVATQAATGEDTAESELLLRDLERLLELTRTCHRLL